MTGSPCSPVLVPFPSFSRRFTYDYCLLSYMAQKEGGAASDCARVLVYDTAKRRMQHVFTVLFSVCPMPQLQPQLSLSPLYMLELSLKRLAILLDCAVVLKTRRIAPVCIGVASQAPPPLLPPPFGILLPWPGRDLCAYAKHTVCLKTRGGKRVRPFLRVGSSFFCFARHAKGCSSSCSPSLLLLPACLVVLSGCASFRLLWHFSYAFLLVF